MLNNETRVFSLEWRASEYFVVEGNENVACV